MRTITLTEKDKVVFGGEETHLTFPRAAGRDAVQHHGQNIWPQVINAILVELHKKYHLTNDERLIGRIALTEQV